MGAIKVMRWEVTGIEATKHYLLAVIKKKQKNLDWDNVSTYQRLHVYHHPFDYYNPSDDDDKNRITRVGLKDSGQKRRLGARRLEHSKALVLSAGPCT